ncbi:MAG TPA: hypothetical protein VGS27_36005 [Candidatus Sulfotelmatobacter sp.]|nr:hypothetical protein [Candidatus Sulfotelmatobacter sp.]
MPSGDPPRPVAVVAVHGVGYCKPYSISCHIASLLLGLGRLRLREGVDWPDGADVAQPYKSYTEEFIQVPLQRVLVSDAEKAQARLVQKTPGATLGDKIWTGVKRLLHFYAESRGYAAEVFSKRRKPGDAAKDITDRSFLGREFMRSQLAGYVSTQDGQAWDTIRLRTERATPEGEPPRKVDIYECYWADLARPQGSIFSFFNALYQLLFHLASLSRTALDYAVIEHIHQFRWRLASFLQAMAVRLLVIFVPILNLILLIAGLVVLPLKIGANHQFLAAALFGLIVFLALLFRPRRVPSHFSSWLGMLAGTYISGFLISWLLFRFVDLGPRGGDVALAVESWLLGEIILLLLMKRYESVRRGAFGTAVFLGAACAVAFVIFLVPLLHDPATPNPVEQASLWTMEVVFYLLSLAWVLLLLCALGARILQFLCLMPLRKAATSSRKAKAEDSASRLAAYARACAAFRTARLSLAVSASMIALVTVFLWAGAFSYTNRTFGLFAGVRISYPPSPFHSITALVVPTDAESRWLSDRTTPEAREKCDNGSINTDSVCAAGTDAPAGGPACPELSADDQKLLQHRLDKAQQVLAANGSLAGQIPIDLESRLEVLEKPAGMRRDRRYGCVYRIFLLENKLGIAGYTEYHFLARALLLASTSSGLPVMIFLIVIAIVVLGWAVARSLIPDGTALNLASNRQCMQLADWLSRGLDSTRAVTSLFWFSIFIVPLVFGSLDYLYSHQYLISYTAEHGWLRELLDHAISQSLSMLDLIGAKVAISGAAIAAIIYRYGRAPLDILLDVDNYLRTSPLENAPRARIAERYVSLLRYIAAQKDRQDPSRPYYGSVVIVAHSLGALISADLLHFLKEEPDPALAPLGYGEKDQTKAPDIPIRLFTFGNPLRQLLNRFFPHIYWWVREEPDNGVRPVAKAVATAPTLANLPDRPRISDLGVAVKLWFNAYRSGDFVGRMLWSDRWYCRNARGLDQGQYSQKKKDEVTIIRDADPPKTERAEMCIGLGGHNDYWNRTAPDMAEKLDKLIQDKLIEKEVDDSVTPAAAPLASERHPEPHAPSPVGSA